MEIINNLSLREKYQNFKTENPKVRIRDAAKSLGVSEAELVATGENTKMLAPEFREILKKLPSLGPIMSLTRNDYAVHERKGKFTKPGFHGQVGLVVNPDIDLRLFLKDWGFAFAVDENQRKSIQFFDKYGVAALKVYLTENSDHVAYQTILDEFTTEKQDFPAVEQGPRPKQAEISDNEVDIKAFQQEWRDLKDTHDFSGLLKKYNLTRLQSLRLAPQGYAEKISNLLTQEVLNAASSTGIDFMVFVGNPSLIQIHTGKAEKILRTGPWINILDETFNLHLNDSQIDSLWVVKKPTELGLVHSVEAFDKDGILIVQFFGKRKPNIPEREDWRALVSNLKLNR
ncbi:hemin-degrading factor [Sphingobacterium shayense]|uniref:hemin-degrading factor n=1 Tax=Sphingobacterium shayense TaxID=626343 RepID=UPI001554F876|nr:ChuX/HutX family heme-like substrate-binding protein [Sphingobacterium shayense]NQD69920.1 hemin-degrading factor [Sphingobacterium shayense]